MTTGINTESSEVDVDPLRDYYGCYSLMEIPESIRPNIVDEDNYNVPKVENIVNSQESNEPIIGPPMDSPWPMFKYDIKNSGYSPYSTANNPGDNSWWLKLDGFIEGSGVIDKEGIMYFVCFDDVYAVYPNKTIKWIFFDMIGWCRGSSPAIDENGTIYIGTVGTSGNYLYAINSDGSLKWKFHVGDWIYSSPAIGNDGTIYFGSETDYIYALYPNGTLKWKYKTSVAVLSSPAIGDDGTIYCGSHDKYLYALYPNNGTLKWRYKTGHWIRVAPCIGDDGTVYCVSLDNHLHAVYPNNGTRKWKTKMGQAGTHPSIGPGGTIYCGYEQLFAINPNGTIKWKYDVSGQIRGSSPCISNDGTIYFGTNNGWFYAINPDGSLKWQRRIKVCEFSPIIDENGKIYVGTSVNQMHDCGSYISYTQEGIFYEFDELDPDAPSAPEIHGPTECKLKKWYNFTFKSESPLNKEISYWIDWGDNTLQGWFGPYNSGHEISKKHRWWDVKDFTIRCRAQDVDGRWGQWGTYDVTIPRDKTLQSNILLRLLERFPLLQKLLFSL
jgi:outer membrane protein assembly factor BamB